MTVQRMAVVDKKNKVVNVILYDSDARWLPPEGCRLIPAGKASPGGAWNGTRFLPPPPAGKAEPSLEERIKTLESLTR